ncbi:MAG: nicotinate (nicotinamide) nucleotide adenylyltransferase [Candidatus Glassbacteria bacterium GWA2_58_10]|uniref:Probable nicotinate-nucleotide adenylyltransferase n=1 Tax=Candidatus Glassbacteria bacterium GWA2_58_10 TaxID=1817865 RepID=A0A1F5YGL8_9BACT|nr:MAG: nicotinate (nicotinamide) nucleotide adenylyltransferase [Candidatus Glassbacteria bacterium GWA2_58_10]
MRIGMLGGTFDPVHLGHLIGAQAAWEGLGLDRVLFVPAARPPHKLEAAITPAKHRVEMLRLALAGDSRFVLYLDEIDRRGRSYTVDTLRRYREKELQPGDELYFILGDDNLLEFDTWKDWRRIGAQARLAALGREGFTADRRILEEKLDGIEVLRIEMPLIGISATGVRAACAAGKPIRYLVPEPVAEYIERHGLYRNVRS